MSKEALLDCERTSIFNALVPVAERYILKKYGHLHFVEELKQTMLLSYAIALSEIDLTKNYKAYCWRRMVWAGNDYLSRIYTKEGHFEAAIGLEQINEEEQLTSRGDDCNATIDALQLIDQMNYLFEKLSTSEQRVVTAELDNGVGDSVSHVNYDKRKRITRYFKKAVMAHYMEN